MRIAVDAFGGDEAPGEIVSGTISAARNLPQDEFFLVGDAETLEPFLEPDIPKNVAVREAEGAVGMNEDPATALRSRPDVSIGVCARLVRSGEADALFSAGNTGATVAASLLGVGRLKNCRRPGIATVLPLSRPVLLIDAGATVQCKPQDLVNFAILGGVFAENYFDLAEKARVALVNVGEEPGKGNDLTKEAHGLMRESEAFRFVGNVEGRDVGRGVADVLVTDGFTGNVMLKTAEGIAQEVFGLVSAGRHREPPQQAGRRGFAARPAAVQGPGRSRKLRRFLSPRRPWLGRDRARQLPGPGRSRTPSPESPRPGPASPKT